MFSSSSSAPWPVSAFSSANLNISYIFSSLLYSFPFLILEFFLFSSFLLNYIMMMKLFLLLVNNAVVSLGTVVVEKEAGTMNVAARPRKLRALKRGFGMFRVWFHSSFLFLFFIFFVFFLLSRKFWALKSRDFSHFGLGLGNCWLWGFFKNN